MICIISGKEAYQTIGVQYGGACPGSGKEEEKVLSELQWMIRHGTTRSIIKKKRQDAIPTVGEKKKRNHSVIRKKRWVYRKWGGNPRTVGDQKKIIYLTIHRGSKFSVGISVRWKRAGLGVGKKSNSNKELRLEPLQRKPAHRTLSPSTLGRGEKRRLSTREREGSVESINKRKGLLICSSFTAKGKEEVCPLHRPRGGGVSAHVRVKGSKNPDYLCPISG